MNGCASERHEVSPIFVFSWKGPDEAGDSWFCFCLKDAGDTYDIGPCNSGFIPLGCFFDLFHTPSRSSLRLCFEAFESSWRRFAEEPLHFLFSHVSQRDAVWENWAVQTWQLTGESRSPLLSFWSSIEVRFVFERSVLVRNRDVMTCLNVFKSPLPQVLRIPKLAPLYQRLLRELCKRFRTREERFTSSDRLWPTSLRSGFLADFLERIAWQSKVATFIQIVKL